jgi:voltage-gated potassium channel
MRLVRLARLLRLARAGVILGRAIQAERRLTAGTAFTIVALVTLFIVVVAGTAEAIVDAREFHSTWAGIWWAVVTITTVGYGDLAPKTVAGRLIGVLLMLVGIGFISVLTATIASHFVTKVSGPDNSELQATLARMELELNEIKSRFAAPPTRHPSASRPLPRIRQDLASRDARPDYDHPVANRDIIRETAELNAHVLELVQMVEDGAGEAIDRRDVEELIDVLRDAVLLLRAVAQDLVGSRAEGAAEYAANDEFRRVVDEVSAANQ